MKTMAQDYQTPRPCTHDDVGIIERLIKTVAKRFPEAYDKFSSEDLTEVENGLRLDPFRLEFNPVFKFAYEEGRAGNEYSDRVFALMMTKGSSVEGNINGRIAGIVAGHSLTSLVTLAETDRKFESHYYPKLGEWYPEHERKDSKGVPQNNLFYLRQLIAHPNYPDALEPMYSWLKTRVHALGYKGIVAGAHPKNTALKHLLENHGYALDHRNKAGTWNYFLKKKGSGILPAITITEDAPTQKKAERTPTPPPMERPTQKLEDFYHD